MLLTAGAIFSWIEDCLNVVLFVGYLLELLDSDMFKGINYSSRGSGLSTEEYNGLNLKQADYEIIVFIKNCNTNLRTKQQRNDRNMIFLTTPHKYNIYFENFAFLKCIKLKC